MHTDTNSKVMDDSPLKMMAHAFSGLMDQTVHTLSNAVRQLTAPSEQTAILESLSWRKFKYFWKSEGVLDLNPAGRRFSWSEYREYSEGMRSHCRSLAYHGMLKQDALFLDVMLENRIQAMISLPSDNTYSLFKKSWTMPQIEKKLDVLVGIRRSGMISSRDFSLAATVIRKELEATTPARIIAAACARVWRANLSASEYAEYMDKQASLIDLQFRSIITIVKNHPILFPDAFTAKIGKKYREMKRDLKAFRKRIPGLTLILEDLNK